MSGIVKRLRETAATEIFRSETCEQDAVKFHCDVAEMATEAADTIADLLAALEIALPTGICLTNRNIPDSMNVPIDATMGELRQIAAAIAKAKGETT